MDTDTEGGRTARLRQRNAAPPKILFPCPPHSHRTNYGAREPLGRVTPSSHDLHMPQETHPTGDDPTIRAGLCQSAG